MSQKLDTPSPEKCLDAAFPDDLKKAVTSVTPELVLNYAAAFAVAGPLGQTKKMPCPSYGLPASECRTGAKLRAVPGSVCASCYALKGRYVFPNVKTVAQRRLESITHPQWENAIVSLIMYASCSHFRWHDSGDIQSIDHLVRIVRIAQRLPDVRFWLPTQEYGLVSAYLSCCGSFPANLAVRVSLPMIDAPRRASLHGGLLTSGVVTSDESCPSATTHGKCGVCRACWDTSVEHVTYKKH